MCFFYLTFSVIKTCLIADASALLVLFTFVKTSPKAKSRKRGCGRRGGGIGFLSLIGFRSIELASDSHAKLIKDAPPLRQESKVLKFKGQ